MAWRSRALRPVTGYVLGLVMALTAAFVSSASDPPPRAAAGEEVRAQGTEIVQEVAPRSYDQPDEAARFFRRKRVEPGRDLDVVSLYLRGRHHVLDMPRYSVRSRRYLPSQGQASQDPSLPLKAELGTWEPLGPGNIGGRTRALVIDPRQPRIRYAAGVSGGIWKTTDNGKRWRPIADLVPNIAVNSLVMDPSDRRVLYAGTGEGYFRELVRGSDLPLRGAGIFKTEDGGKSWTRLAGTKTSDFYWVNDIVVSYNDSRRLYAATRTGVWRSVNGGRTWKQVLESQVMGGCLDLVLRSDRETDVLFAACGTFDQGTVYRNESAERGRRWVPVLREDGMARTSLALAPSNQDIVYALASRWVPREDLYNGGLHALFRSDAGGEAGSWVATTRYDDPVLLNTLLLSNPLPAHFVICGLNERNYMGNMGWYTNVVAVDPLDPDIVWVGGVDLMRSDDGGHNWGLATFWWDSPPSAHADQHAIVFHPRYDGVDNQVLFATGDGGVWVTPNARASTASGEAAACDSTNTAVRWRSLNHNFGVTQFYHGAAFADGTRYLGGTQDNGVLMGSDDAGSDGWWLILGGDGGYVAVDPTNPEVIYTETIWLDFNRSIDGGRTFNPAIDGITEPSENFLFIAPFTMDPSNPDRLWLGGRHLWRTDDGAASWNQASVQLSANAWISAVAVSPHDPDRVVVGLSDGRIRFTDRATTADAATEWQRSRTRRGGWVAALAFDPNDDGVVYATYSTFGGKHVFKSVDAGATFRSIDGSGGEGLPDVPVHSIVVDPTDSRRLFLGTDLGVLVSPQGGRRWAVENTGFANAVTESLSVVRHADGSATLFAFTHGRGTWRVKLLESGAAASP